MMERGQIMEYVQETPIIPRRVIQYSVPRQTITKPSPHVEMSIGAETLQDIDLPQHPVIHDSWQNKEYTTQRHSGMMEEQTLNFEEQQNEHQHRSIGLIKRVNTFFRKRSSSRKNSIKSTGDVNVNAGVSTPVENRVNGVGNLKEQSILRNIKQNPKGNEEENNKRYGLFSFEETPPVQVPGKEFPNPVEFSPEHISLTGNKPSPGSSILRESYEAKFSPLESALIRSPIGGKHLLPDEVQNDTTAQNSRLKSMKERKIVLQTEQNRLIMEIIRLENILNKHRKDEAYIIQNSHEELPLQKSNSPLARGVGSTAPYISTFGDSLRDRCFTLQSLQEDELTTIKERNCQIAKIDNMCLQVKESIERRQEMETKLRDISQSNDSELLFLMMENKIRQKSSVVIQTLSDITKEKSKRFIAEEQSFINQNEVKPLISDLSASVNKLSSILEIKNTCIRRLSNQ